MVSDDNIIERERASLRGVPEVEDSDVISDNSLASACRYS